MNHAACWWSKPLLITTWNTQSHIHKHGLTPHTLNCEQPMPVGILVLVSRGAQWAVRGITPMPTQLGGEVKARQAEGQTDGQIEKVAICTDRLQGHMVEPQTGWCSAALCCVFSLKVLWVHTETAGGGNWWSFERNYSNCIVSVWVWLILTSLISFSWLLFAIADFSLLLLQCLMCLTCSFWMTRISLRINKVSIYLFYSLLN